MWRIGIPPSGAFDHLACRLANSLVSNAEDAAVFECLMLGTGLPTTLRFHCDTVVAVTGVQCHIRKKKGIFPQYAAIPVSKGESIEIVREKSDSAEGCRCYVGVRGGIAVPKYLGSRSTFVQGEFGGYQGRSLLPGDVVPIGKASQDVSESREARKTLPVQLWPKHQRNWTIGVLPGPRANPDFMTDDDIAMLHSTEWQVHHSSNRLGIRLNGPKPQWARTSGEEGGTHPSNIHDEEYAVGTVNFTGDMPIIIAHDGPSLGGFVCPITIVQSELWKIGQVQAGDTIQFALMSLEEAISARLEQDRFIRSLRAGDVTHVDHPALQDLREANIPTQAILLETKPTANGHPGMEVRLTGDKHVLVAYGPMVLDLSLRVRVHLLEQALLDASVRPAGLEETAPGVRSLQIRYDPLKLPLPRLLELLRWVDGTRIGVDISTKCVQSRVFRLPMAFNSRGCAEAMNRYSKSVRDDAPYLPCNIDYIAKNNCLSRDDVYEKCYRASYMCLGLGDVYLGACCAVSLDPRDRMITSKMNPARTWTEEGTVGLGGAYMCIYPMNSPGGYQLVGRTLPIWNTWGKHQPSIFSADKPWMLDMFDQIRFYACEEAELDTMREDFRRGTFVPNMTKEEFRLAAYETFLDSIKPEVDAYKARQHAAMDLMTLEDKRSQERMATRLEGAPETDAVCELSATIVPKHHVGVEANITANVWEVTSRVSSIVCAGDVLLVLDSMKMHIKISSPVDGVVTEVHAAEGQTVQMGTVLVVIKPAKAIPSGRVASPLRKRQLHTSAHGGNPSKVDAMNRQSMQIASLKMMYSAGEITVHDVVDLIFDAIEKRDRENGEDNFGNIWISRPTRSEVHETLNRTFDQGEFDVVTSPLYGIPFVVKDNIDVAGYVTTSACPGYETTPAAQHATCVQKLLDAGAIFIGKTNMDQFAAGLVGIRSPYGECYNGFHPEYISGGSSSGSAVAVSLGFASFSLGTDTAGSGRVPASLNNIVGLKPSRGLISCAGMVPACRSLDCVSIFALAAQDSLACLKVMQGDDDDDCFTREPLPRLHPSTTQCSLLGGQRSLRVGIPRADQLNFFGNDLEGRRAFDTCVQLLRDTLGAEVEYVDYELFLETASLLYDGPWVAERLAALEEVVVGDRAKDTSLEVLEVTRSIVLNGAKYSAVDMHRALYRLESLRKKTIGALFQKVSDGVPVLDILMTPTVGTCYTRSAVRADPVQTSSNNGYYTNFVNLLDMAAIAVPCGFVEMEPGKSMPFGVTFSCPAFGEELLVHLATHVQMHTGLALGQIGEVLLKEEKVK